jgi:hypothetical protein
MPVTGGRDVDVEPVVGATASVAVGGGAVSVGITAGEVTVATGNVGGSVAGTVGGRGVGVTAGCGEQAARVKIKTLKMVLIFIFILLSFICVILTHFDGNGCNKCVARRPSEISNASNI